MNLESLKNKTNLDPKQIDIYLDFEIYYCFEYSIKFSDIRNDKRRFDRSPGTEDEITIYPKNGENIKMATLNSDFCLSSRIDADNKDCFFDAQIKRVVCRNMEVDNYLSVTVRKSPWSRKKPHLVVNALRYIEGRWILFHPYKGELHEYDKKINIVTSF